MRSALIMRHLCHWLITSLRLARVVQAGAVLLASRWRACCRRVATGLCVQTPLPPGMPQKSKESQRVPLKTNIQRRRERPTQHFYVPPYTKLKGLLYNTYRG